MRKQKPRWMLSVIEATKADLPPLPKPGLIASVAAKAPAAKT